VASSLGLACRGQAAADEIHQGLGEEGVVVGGAVPYLHGVPHRLGEAAPGRIDQRQDVGVGEDEDAGEVEQQRCVLVGARVEALQGRQQVTAAKVRITDELERCVGGDELLPCKHVQQVTGASADDPVHLRARRHPIRLRDGSSHRMLLRKLIDQRGQRFADGGPIG
jgi:hypothetical protein